MIIQMPVSNEMPPVPMSMRHHYAEGELDQRGYIKTGYMPPPLPSPKRCDYCGRIIDKCGCGASK